MKYTESFSLALNKFKEDPGGINGPYWSMIIDWISDCVHNKSDIAAVLDEMSDLLDFGICSEVSGTTDHVRESVIDEDLSGYSLRVVTFTEWLNKLYFKIVQGDRKEILEKEIQCVQIQRKKLRYERDTCQQERKNKIVSLLDEKTRTAKMGLIDGIVQMDDLMYYSLQMKKAIAQGIFFSVTQKREHFDREKQLQKEVNWFNNFVDMQTDKDDIAEIRKIHEKINVLINAIIDCETTIEKLASEIQTIEKKKSEVSPAEIESRIRKELEYLRDLLKLAACRLRLTPCPITTAEQKLFSYKKISKCLDRIQEFDPEVFHNDRVSLFGKPEVIVLPGTGTAIYDWKNNCIIVPLVIPGDNVMASIATGIIDYRIDVDEEKTLIHTYNQLSERKSIRSTVELRAMLTKDYITWMTSEYNGFRVLPKGVKEWFEHSIAPSRNEIYTPPEYRTSVLPPSEFETQVKVVEKALAGEISEVDEKMLWVGSILLYQKGKFDISLELLQVVLKRNPDHAMAWYNAGLIASKLNHRQEAITFFTEYTTRYPQCWWARIARDHIRRLQT